MAAHPQQTDGLRTVRNSVWPVRARRLVTTVGVAWLAAVAVNRAMVEVRGPSMLPTLWPGDRVLTLPRVGPLGPGTVVVLRDPGDPDHLVIKRVHAIGADGIDVRGDHAGVSTDSRHFGPVPVAAIRRRVLRRWPDLRTPLAPAPGGDAPVRGAERR